MPRLRQDLPGIRGAGLIPFPHPNRPALRPCGFLRLFSVAFLSFLWYTLLGRPFFAFQTRSRILTVLRAIAGAKVGTRQVAHEGTRQWGAQSRRRAAVYAMTRQQTLNALIMEAVDDKSASLRA